MLKDTKNLEIALDATLATDQGIKLDSLIKEEKMPQVEVHNNDIAAQQYLAKLNFQARPDLKAKKQTTDKMVTSVEYEK